MLIKLSDLDAFQKISIFGQKASYWILDATMSSLESRASLVNGVAAFGVYSSPEIEQLTAPELRNRLRQANYRIYQLELGSVIKEYGAYQATTLQDCDPKGYFATMMMRPDTPEEVFEEILKRSYRVLAMKFHPDKNNKDDTKFKELQNAYKFLLNPENRTAYRNSPKEKASPT